MARASRTPSVSPMMPRMSYSRSTVGVEIVSRTGDGIVGGVIDHVSSSSASVGIGSGMACGMGQFVQQQVARGVGFVDLGRAAATPVRVDHRQQPLVRGANVFAAGIGRHGEQLARMEYRLAAGRGLAQIVPRPAPQRPAAEYRHEKNQKYALEHYAASACAACPASGSLSPASKPRISCRATRWLVPSSPRWPLSSRVSPLGNSSR